MVAIGGIASDLISCCLDMQSSLLSPVSLVEELFGQEFNCLGCPAEKVTWLTMQLVICLSQSICKYERLNSETLHGSLNHFEEFDGVCFIWITVVILEL